MARHDPLDQQSVSLWNIKQGFEELHISEDASADHLDKKTTETPHNKTTGQKVKQKIERIGAQFEGSLEWPYGSLEFNGE